MESGHRSDLNMAISNFKTPTGSCNYKMVLSIKRENRLPQLALEDRRKITALVVVGLTGAMESLNLKRPLSANQIMDLSDIILDSSSEDNLALEDLMIFLQKLTRGEYGEMYESMDISKFMQKFELYREERFQALRNIRDEEEASYRPDYSEKRSSEELSMEERMKYTKALIEYDKVVNNQHKG